MIQLHRRYYGFLAEPTKNDYQTVHKIRSLKQILIQGGSSIACAIKNYPDVARFFRVIHPMVRYIVTLPMLPIATSSHFSAQSSINFFMNFT